MADADEQLDGTKLIIPARDANGHSLRLQARVMPQDYHEANRIVSSQHFPFRDTASLVRFCLRWGLRRLNGLMPIRGNLLKQADAMTAVVRQEQLNREFMEIFQVAHAEVQRHIMAGEPGEAKRLALEIRTQIQGMEQGYWRGRCEREYATRIGALVDPPKIQEVQA